MENARHGPPSHSDELESDSDSVGRESSCSSASQSPVDGGGGKRARTLSLSSGDETLKETGAWLITVPVLVSLPLPAFIETDDYDAAAGMDELRALAALPSGADEKEKDEEDEEEEEDDSDVVVSSSDESSDDSGEDADPAQSDEAAEELEEVEPDEEEVESNPIVLLQQRICITPSSASSKLIVDKLMARAVMAFAETTDASLVYATIHFLDAGDAERAAIDGVNQALVAQFLRDGHGRPHIKRQYVRPGTMVYRSGGMRDLYLYDASPQHIDDPSA
jgi:hypothetical protein